MNQILLVEDEEGLRANIKEMLTLSGYQVSDAADVAEALRILSALQPDLIISDLMMPNMDGYEFLEQVRSRANLLDVPFIILSALSEKSNIRKGMLYGAEDYLTKPFEFQDLLASVKLMIHKRRQVKKLINDKVDSIIASERNASIHELKTPLFAIDASLKMLLEDLNSKNFSKGDAEELINIALKSSKRLAYTIDKIERFQRLKHRGFIPSGKKNSVALKDIQSWFEGLQSHFEPPLDNLELQIDEKEVFKIDAAFVYTPFIVSELLLNAMKFSERPGVIRVVLSENSIQVCNQYSPVLDPNTFNIEAFKQYDRDESEVQGLGLGLYLCKQYIGLAEGALLVDLSKPYEFCIKWMLV